MVEIQKKNCVIRTPRKSTEVSDFVEVSLEGSKYINVTDNRKQRKWISKDSRQELHNESLTNDYLNNFSGNKEAIIEEQHNTNVVLSNKIGPEKNSGKLEIPTKDSLLFSEITRSNLIDQKMQMNFLVI